MAMTGDKQVAIEYLNGLLGLDALDQADLCDHPLGVGRQQGNGARGDRPHGLRAG
jgi:hypothetical protein